MLIDSYLENALTQNTLPHALLFIGEAGASYAKNLAIKLLKTDIKRIEASNHPDHHEIYPEGKSGVHTIDSIRSLIDLVYRAPFESKRKVFVLHSIERMQPAASNALLKTLEEPLLDTHLILLTNDARQILPTILSRCTQLTLPDSHSLRSIDFTRFDEELHRVEKEIDAIEDPLLYSKRVDELLALLMMWMRDAHARRAGISENRLFFPNAPEPKQIFSLEKWEESLQKVRLANQRNIKISTCIDQIIARNNL